MYRLDELMSNSYDSAKPNCQRADIFLNGTATLNERDTDERGQLVHQLVLESRVAGF